MTLKLRKDRTEESGDAVWYHVGRIPSSGKLVGWTDEDEVDQDWLANVPKLGRVQVAPFGSGEFTQYQKRQAKRNRRFRDPNGEFPPELERRMLFENAARNVLKDWDGIELEDGTNGDYTPAKGIKALSESQEFEALVVGLSSDLDQDRKAQLTEDANALGNGSGGKSSGAGSSGTRRSKPATTD